MGVLNGKPTYMIFDFKSQSFIPAEDSMLRSMAEEALKKAKEYSCSLSIKPASITVSIGVVSFSWESEKLCK